MSIVDSIVIPTVAEWARPQRVEDVISSLRGAGLAVAPVNDASMILKDPHFAARRMIVSVAQGDGPPVNVPGNPIKLSAVMDDPRSQAGQAIRIASPGDDTFAVLKELLELNPDEVEALAASGAIVQSEESGAS